MYKENVFNYFLAFFACFIFISHSNSFAQVPQKPDPNFDIYLLMGQSNMAGRGPLTSALKEINHPMVLAWGINQEWVIAKHPVHYDKPSAAGVGPGLAFGMAMQEASPGKKIGLVPCAVGGTAIAAWLPGGYDQATKTHPYDDAVIRIKEAMKYGVIKGVIWHQGESNSGPVNILGYLDLFKTLVTNIRTLVGNPNLPIVMGELGRYRDSYQPFNQLIANVPSQIKNLAIVSSEGLIDHGDGTHFDANSANLLGERFAKRMIEMRKIKSKKKAK
jgi:hypothetical protein